MDLLMNSNCGVFNVDRGSSNSGKYNAIILLDCLPFNEYIIKSDPFLSKVTVIDRMMLLVADKAYHDDIVNLSKDNSKLSDVQEEVEQLKKLFNEN
jgi:hypothetical protein